MSWSEDADLSNYGDLTLPDPHTYTSPAAADVVSSDWQTQLKSAADIVGGIVGTASGIMSARDGIVNARDQRAIDLAQKQSDNSLAMQKIAADSQIAQLGFAAQIAKAKQALAGATGGAGIGLTGLLVIGGIAYAVAKH